MGDLTVFVSPTGVTGGILEALRDLSANGLVDPFYWVADPDVGRSTAIATEVTQGRVRTVELQMILGARNHSRVRLCVVVPVFADQSMPDRDAVRTLDDLLSSSSGAAMSRIRALVVRPGGPVVAGVTVEGWHNILVAAEDSRGPGGGRVATQPTRDPVVVGRHAAPAIAGITGLWADVENGPLDDDAPPPGQVIRVARSFYRRFDTNEVENSLRRAVFDTGESLPVPRAGAGGSVRHIDDAALAANQMAQALWIKHRAVLRGPRTTPPAVAKKRVGLREAIKMLLSFMLAAFKNAPSEWYAGLVRKSSTKLAGMVHSSVYGSDDSAYSVVVNGVDASGAMVDPAQLGTAAGRIDEVLANLAGERTHAALPDMSAVWEDFANGAMTLADAGERSQGLPPIQIGSQRGILRSASACVASDHDRFHVAGPVAAVVGAQSIGVNDVHALTNLANRLRAAEGDPMVGIAARSTFEELRDWARAHSTSYGARVGKILYDEIGKCQREINVLMATIRGQATADDLTADVQGRQRRLARILQIVTAVFAVGIVALGVVTGLGLVNTYIGVGLLVVSVLGWMATTVITFMRGQRELFQELSRRQADAAQAEADQANLRTAVRDLRRMTAAYAQYQCWSTVVGELLHRPFGAAVDDVVARPLIGYGLPLSAKLGAARPGPDVVADAGLTIRREVFTVGWLTSVWQEVVTGAGRGLGALGQDVRDNPRLLFADLGAGSGSALDHWAQKMASDSTPDVGSDALWAQVKQSLAAEASPVGAALVDQVVTVVDGAVQVVPITEFMAGLESDDHGVQYFDDEMFTDVAVAAGRNRVATNRRFSVRTGLGSTAVLTQFSEAVPDFDFRFVGVSDSVRGDSTPSQFNGVFPDRSADFEIPAGPGVEPPGSGSYVF